MTHQSPGVVPIKLFSSFLLAVMACDLTPAVGQASDAVKTHAGTLVVVVREATGARAANVLVSVGSVSTDGFRAHYTTDTTGVVVFSGIPPGRYRLVVRRIWSYPELLDRIMQPGAHDSVVVGLRTYPPTYGTNGPCCEGVGTHGSSPVFGTFAVTQFGHNTMTGATTTNQFVLVFAPEPFSREVLDRLRPTDPTPSTAKAPSGERACWLAIPTGNTVSSAAGIRTNWRIVGDSVDLTLWFGTDAGTSLWFRSDSTRIRGMALSTGWMPAPPDGRGSPMNLRDSIVGVRLGDADPAKCFRDTTHQ